VRRRQPRQRGGQRPALALGADGGVDPVGEGLGHRVMPGAGEHPVLLDLRPAVAAHEVGGDSVQPRPGALALEVVPVALVKRGEERLRHHVVGRADSDAAAHVALDPGGVAAEQHGEVLGLIA
jgi:hypothetical protein